MTGVAAALLAGLTVAGCAAMAAGGPRGSGDGGAAGGGATADGVRGRTFLSTKVTDGGAARPLVSGSRVTLSFTDDGLRAHAGCNSMGGTARFDGARLVVQGGLTMTEMGCEPKLMEQDQWLAGLLSAGAQLTVDGDRLVLTSGRTVIELVDRRVADPDRPLVGTTWTLDGFVDGDTASSVPGGVAVTLRLDGQGRVALDLGCNTGTGSVRVDGSTLRFGAIRSTTLPCPSLESSVGGQVLDVLDGAAVTADVEAGTLTLTNGSRGLTFRAG
jgi:heat shock protein HslJ